MYARGRKEGAHCDRGGNRNGGAALEARPPPPDAERVRHIAESVAISASLSVKENTSRSSARYTGLCAAVTTVMFC